MSLPEIQSTTGIVIALIIAFIAIYDVWAYIKGGVQGTISYKIIIEWSRKYPAFTFAVGFAMGHLFWPFSVC